MKARDVMSSPVITVRADTPIRAAAALLASHGFTAAPVVEHGQVIGIVSEANLVRGQIPPEGWMRPEAWDRPTPQTVKEVMTGAPISAQPDTDLTDLVSTMLESGIRSMLIVEDGELVGIVSRRDVLRVVARGELTSEEVWRRRAGLAGHDRRTVPSAEPAPTQPH